MNLLWKSVLAFLVLILLVRGVLTLIVSRTSDGERIEMGMPDASLRALILYNPDSFYNLDVQLCSTFGEQLTASGWGVIISPYSKLRSDDQDKADMLVICSNTYNFAPDDPTMDFLRGNDRLQDMPVVALTLGSGSTRRAQRLLEQEIEASGAVCSGSRSFWLMKPNNVYRMDEDNVKVAIDMVKEFAIEVLEEMEGVKE